MTRPSLLIALATATVLASAGAAVVHGRAHAAHDELKTAAASSGTYYGPIVFYSGKGEAGLGDADPYSGWEFVDNNKWAGNKYSDWSAGGCNPYRADDFPSDRGLHMLVGYSLGRLGPVYFLRAAEHDAPARWDEIDTIYLLDPGNFTEMNSNECDAAGEMPSAILERWLAGSAERTLVVVSAAASNTDGAAGIKKFYLHDLYRSRQDVADRVFLCIDDANTAHDTVVKEFIPDLNGERACPHGTRRDALTVIPPQAAPAPVPPAQPAAPTTGPPAPAAPAQPPPAPPAGQPSAAPPAPARPASPSRPPASAAPAPPTAAAEPSHRVSPYSNWGDGAAGHAMCRGNPDRPESTPGGTATQTFTVGNGVASIDAATVQIDPDSRVTAHASLSVNGTARTSADATAAGDTQFSFQSVNVRAGDQVALSIRFSATYGKIITVYTVGNPGGTFTATNSCSDGAPSESTSATGLRAIVSGSS